MIDCLFSMADCVSVIVFVDGECFGYCSSPPRRRCLLSSSFVLVVVALFLLLFLFLLFLLSSTLSSMIGLLYSTVCTYGTAGR